jgi:hypothetical protein
MSTAKTTISTRRGFATKAPRPHFRAYLQVQPPPHRTAAQSTSDSRH